MKEGTRTLLWEFVRRLSAPAPSSAATSTGMTASRSVGKSEGPSEHRTSTRRNFRHLPDRQQVNTSSVTVGSTLSVITSSAGRLSGAREPAGVANEVSGRLALHRSGVRQAMRTPYAEQVRQTPGENERRHGNDGADQELHELLTVEDVADLLKVSKSWVYEHIRSRTCREPSDCPTSRSASTCALRCGPCERFSTANAGRRDL